MNSEPPNEQHIKAVAIEGDSTKAVGNTFYMNSDPPNEQHIKAVAKSHLH